MLNQTFTNNDGSCFKVISILKDVRNKTCYRVQFPEGYETSAYKRAILLGSVRNPFHPVVETVGFLGNANIKGHEKEYQIWRSILKRCCNPKSTDYASYGALGVIVDSSWHSFEQFLTDLPSIEGYDVQMFKNGEIHLDKDLKSEDVKTYSKDTCTFISPERNRSLIDHYTVHFKAISPDGVEYQEKNAKRFAKEHGLNPTHIANVLKGRYKTHRGWTFQYVR